jgi:hypothetical protein
LDFVSKRKIGKKCTSHEHVIPVQRLQLSLAKHFEVPVKLFLRDDTRGAGVLPLLSERKHGRRIFLSKISFRKSETRDKNTNINILREFEDIAFNMRIYKQQVRVVQQF